MRCFYWAVISEDIRQQSSPPQMIKKNKDQPNRYKRNEKKKPTKDWIARTNMNFGDNIFSRACNLLRSSEFNLPNHDGERPPENIAEQKRWPHETWNFSCTPVSGRITDSTCKCAKKKCTVYSFDRASYHFKYNNNINFDYELVCHVLVVKLLWKFDLLSKSQYIFLWLHNTTKTIKRFDKISSFVRSNKKGGGFYLFLQQESNLSLSRFV